MSKKPYVWVVERLRRKKWLIEADVYPQILEESAREFMKALKKDYPWAKFRIRKYERVGL